MPLPPTPIEAWLCGFLNSLGLQRAPGFRSPTHGRTPPVPPALCLTLAALLRCRAWCRVRLHCCALHPLFLRRLPGGQPPRADGCVALRRRLVSGAHHRQGAATRAGGVVPKHGAGKFRAGGRRSVAAAGKAAARLRHGLLPRWTDSNAAAATVQGTVKGEVQGKKEAVEAMKVGGRFLPCMQQHSRSFLAGPLNRVSCYHAPPCLYTVRCGLQAWLATEGSPMSHVSGGRSFAIDRQSGASTERFREASCACRWSGPSSRTSGSSRGWNIPTLASGGLPTMTNTGLLNCERREWTRQDEKGGAERALHGSLGMEW